MNLTISPQIRILAVVGLALAVVGGAASLLLGRSTPTVSSSPSPHRATTQATAPTRTTPARPAPHTATTPPTTAHTKTKAQSKPAHATAPHAKPAHAKAAHRGNLVDARLPGPLQWQLSQHRIVVVSVYNPQADVDAISVAEAHAGATEAKAGYLLVSVLDNKVAGLLTGLLPAGTMLPDPGILIYRAPGTLVYRFDGFLDRDGVAQAAADAEAGQADPSLSGTSPATP
jgi:hypothetical protein